MDTSQLHIQICKNISHVYCKLIILHLVNILYVKKNILYVKKKFYIMRLGKTHLKYEAQIKSPQLNLKQQPK